MDSPWTSFRDRWNNQSSHEILSFFSESAPSAVAGLQPCSFVSLPTFLHRLEKCNSSFSHFSFLKLLCFTNILHFLIFPSSFPLRHKALVGHVSDLHAILNCHFLLCLSVCLSFSRQLLRLQLSKKQKQKPPPQTTLRKLSPFLNPFIKETKNVKTEGTQSWVKIS